MNQHRTEKEWNKLAVEMGYPTMALLLYKFYVDRGYTTRKIASDVLDVSKDRVIQLLRQHNIPLRSRGGVRA